MSHHHDLDFDFEIEREEGKQSHERFVLFPIRYPKLWEMYKKHMAAFWTAEEIDLSDDLDDWKSLTENEQHFISYVLAFFAVSDGIVLENLALRFMEDVPIAEARCFYGFQIAMENVHAETYSLLIDTYITEPIQKHILLNAVEYLPTVERKSSWALKWITSNESFAKRLIAFACVEGIFFSGSFCSIFWLKKRGLMPGLSFSNQLISRDEGLHRDFACLLYSTMGLSLEVAEIHDLVREAVEIEQDFVSAALPVSLIGMNASQMSCYIEYVADHLLETLGVEPLYGTPNPFDWMIAISTQGKSNFFECRVGEYQKSGVLTPRDETFEFDLTADF